MCHSTKTTKTTKTALYTVQWDKWDYKALANKEEKNMRTLADKRALFGFQFSVLLARINTN